MTSAKLNVCARQELQTLFVKSSWMRFDKDQYSGYIKLESTHQEDEVHCHLPFLGMANSRRSDKESARKAIDSPRNRKCHQVAGTERLVMWCFKIVENWRSASDLGMLRLGSMHQHREGVCMHFAWISPSHTEVAHPATAAPGNFTTENTCIGVPRKL
jgi:hypothetical protein